ncbi:MAG: hypothetical protein IPM56_01095 [Ignavibacteriales bacterium]|nr:MAG: hypothetical protein IPM56_01095 [Ignavibacteriales bacterium]
MPCATPAHRRCAYGSEGWTDPESRLFNSYNRNVRRLDRENDTTTLVIRNDIVSFRLRCNHPDRPNDVGGAFLPESFYFSHYNFVPVGSTYVVDNGECALVRGEITNPVSYDQRKRKVLDALDSLPASQPMRVVAFFCHGWQTGFQFGFKTNTSVEYQSSTYGDCAALAEAIARIATPDVKVVLYACSTGATDDGFAATLRDELATRRPNCRVDAHKTLGHSTKNPFVNRFEAPAGTPGQMIVPTDHRLWGKWRRVLNNPFDEGSTLLWKFSQMSTTEIHEHLDSL